MLNEETLILFATTGACALLVLGVLELVSPTRPRHLRYRRASGRDPVRSGKPVAASLDLGRVTAAQVAFEQSRVSGTNAAAGAGFEPPIERLLISEAESVSLTPAPATFDAEPEPTQAPPVAAPPTQAKASEEPLAEQPPARERIEVGPAPDRDAAPEPLAPVATACDGALDAPAASERLGVEPPCAEPESQEAATGPSPADRCYALYEGRRFHDVIAEAGPLLENASSGAVVLAPRDTAWLRGVIGLARQALGDHDGARAALEEAVATAPDWDRATWQRHLAALAAQVGQHLLVQAQNGSADAEERVTTLRSAIVWLDGGLACAPDDPALRDKAASARAALWPTYEQVTTELIQRQDYHLARRLLRQALGDGECPAPVRGALRDLLATTYSGEVGQLTAESIRRMQEGKEEEALATLDRAEGLLATIPDQALTDKRRQELERRLWWSFTKAGMRRLDGGMYEEALGPLLHALRFASVGSERLDETKRPLARALESAVKARTPLVQRLATKGDKDGALVLCERLWTFLCTAMEQGMTRDELATALDGTRALFEKLGKPKR